MISGSTRNDGDITPSEISQVEGYPAYRSAMALFPNPAQNLVNLNYHSRTNETVSVEVINLMGQQLQLFNQDVNEGMNTFRVSLNDMPEGTYMIRLRAGDEQFTERLVIAR